MKVLMVHKTYKGGVAVHVKEISKDDKIKVERSCFSLFYLENVSERFRVDESLRPLDDLNRITDLWDEIKSRLTSGEWSISQIYAFWDEVIKRREYGGKLFKNFVESDLVNILKISPNKDEKVFHEILQASVDGLLELCLYWNLKVRKMRVIREE